ncbi:hypothetical protein GJU41_12725 [Bacillus idriensis]|uniref:Uncharacterized protein n=1 Tax=Metabacillus idriensis TaxID=324768 RepID=A0A6I2MAN7_9BACI|nr:hypothetical protein [Metabacillus idriensis]MRX54839.1 hypothetical protein [Metabacillus idriensis]
MAKIQVSFNRNVKIGEDRYAAGESATVSKKDYESLLESGVINSVDSVPEDVDFFGLSREELSKVKNDDLKAFLDIEGLAYESSFTKEELINVIVGEEA